MFRKETIVLARRWVTEFVLVKDKLKTTGAKTAYNAVTAYYRVIRTDSRLVRLVLDRPADNSSLWRERPYELIVGNPDYDAIFKDRVKDLIRLGYRHIRPMAWGEDLADFSWRVIDEETGLEPEAERLLDQYDRMMLFLHAAKYNIGAIPIEIASELTDATATFMYYLDTFAELCPNLILSYRESLDRMKNPVHKSGAWVKRVANLIKT